MGLSGAVPQGIVQEPLGLNNLDIPDEGDLGSEDLASLHEHAALSGGEAVLGAVDGEVADHLGDLRDLPALYLLPVVFEPVVPVGGHLGSVATEDCKRLRHTLLVRTGPQTCVAVGGNADRELCIGQIDYIVAPDLAEDSLLFYPRDTPCTVVRVDYYIPLGKRDPGLRR